MVRTRSSSSRSPTAWRCGWRSCICWPESKMKWLLKGGHVVDPANGRNGLFDLLLDGGCIARVGRDLPVNTADADFRVIEIPRGLIVCPGLIDLHVHLREPGQEHKETVLTGTRAAVAG